ncbi:MAG: M23 family metallopeptidase [Croceibacterium sp.]
MFKDRANDAIEVAGGGNFPPVYSSRAQIVEPPVTPVRLVRFGTWRERLGGWGRLASARLAAIDVCPDLAVDIGSKRWLRGLATFAGLSALALSGWPDFAPLQAAPAMRIDVSTREEFRGQMIMPLALGGDSGRRMGATALVAPLRNVPDRPRLELEATLAQGDSFGRMLERAGVGGAEADLIASMVGSEMPLAEIAPGTKIDLTLGRRPAPGAPRPVDALSFRARFDLQLAVERHGGRLTLDPRPIKVDGTPLRIRGMVGPSLYRSARAAGAPANAVQQYLRALSADLDMDSGIAAGDEFDLVVEYKRAATGEVEAGKLLYAGLLSPDGKPRKQLLRWGNDGRFFEASGVGEMQSGMVSPVAGHITSTFGMRRHPILGYTRLHAGIDFGAQYGSPIYAVTDGTVQYAGWHGGHGNFVKLDHGGGLGTGYGHMSRIAVSPGMRVRRGQVIGYVGSTGLSTGPHLHYEVYRGGVPVNPAGLTFATRSELEGKELAAFRARLTDLKRIAPGAALTPLTAATADARGPVREIDRLDTAAIRG